MAAWICSDLREELLCGICQNQLRCPVFLSCGHTFCMGCLDDLHLDRPGPILVCPSCRSPTKLPRDGVKSLPVNHAHQRMLEKRWNSIRVPCLVCEEIPPRGAVKSCRQCKLSYCGPCLEQLHPNRGNLGQHELIEPRHSLEVTPGEMCQVHGEKLSLYCRNCNKPGCMVCEKVGKHRDHTVLDLETAYQHIQVEIRGKYNYLYSRLTKSKNDLKRLESILKTQQRTVDQFQEKVAESHDRLIGVINDRKSAILNKTRQKMDEFANKIISNCLAIRNSVDDNERCVGLLSETLSESDHLKFLEAAPALKLRLDMALRLSHQTERNVSHYSLRTEDECSDIIQRGYYTVTVSDSLRKDNNVTLRVKDGRLANYRKLPNHYHIPQFHQCDVGEFRQYITRLRSLVYPEYFGFVHQ